MKANVEIYTWSHCPYSKRAKALLEKKGVQYMEHCIDGDEVARAVMSQRANGRRTLPQIFINDQHIGGCDDLYILEEICSLDEILYFSSLSLADMKIQQQQLAQVEI